MNQTLPGAAPEPTLRRLPAYYRFLKQLQREGRGMVSCTHIAHEFDLDPTQVRKDLACTGIVGKPKVGYEVTVLLAAVESFLGWDNMTEAFLAGVGSLGTALLGYEGFAEHGLKIIAAFDVDPQKVGSQVHGHRVLPLAKLENLARRMHVHIGIITTPAEAAQAVADQMVAGGIKAIWNFAPAPVRVPPGVVIEHQQLASSLAVLSSKLAGVLRESAPEAGGAADVRSAAR